MIYPQPKQLKRYEGTYWFPDSCPDDLLTFCKLCQNKKYIIFQSTKILGPEEYRLEINSAGITITSSGE